MKKSQIYFIPVASGDVLYRILETYSPGHFTLQNNYRTD
jgi:hypothetical protein